MYSSYEVLNPWAEVDPITLKGLSPRLKDLTGRKIGLFINSKIASSPMQAAVQQRLRERFPTLEFSRFAFMPNLEVSETEDKSRFLEWIKEVDAAIFAVGD
jgi:hypothetical protein